MTCQLTLWKSGMLIEHQWSQLSDEMVPGNRTNCVDLHGKQTCSFSIVFYNSLFQCDIFYSKSWNGFVLFNWGNCITISQPALAAGFIVSLYHWCTNAVQGTCSKALRAHSAEGTADYETGSAVELHKLNRLGDRKLLFTTNDRWMGFKLGLLRR